MLLLLHAAAFGQSLTPSTVNLETRSGLEDLGDIAAEVEVFGIGESIHGSAGLEAARFAAAEVALEDLGFEAVGLEISWVEARRVDDMLQQCTDGAQLDEPSRGSDDWSEAWEGFLPLLAYLCHRNRSHPPIRIFGIDITDPWSARDLLEGDGTDTALRAHCFGARFDSARALSEWGKTNNYPNPTRQDHRACLRHLKALQRGALTEDQALAVASLRANEQRTWAQYVHDNIPSAYNIREQAMTAFFLAEHERLGRPRVVLMAHDGHVARSHDLYRPIGARLASQVSYANLSVDGLVVETRMGARFDPPPPDPDSPAHQWAQLEGPVVLVLHPGLRHDGTLYLDYARRDP